jgi:amidase
MGPKIPTLDQVARIAQELRLNLDPDRVEAFRKMIGGLMPAFARLDQLTEPGLDVRYPRTCGWRPTAQDNPLGAWYWRCEVQGASSGILGGKTVAIKDNVCVAGIPMMNGCAVLEGYVPEVDATIVNRILDAGGQIVGKAVCEALCCSTNANSHTSDTGPVYNPFDLTRSTGGSSSGSAALLAAGEVDMAIGGDQGGSIRIPASWCGVYGLKPTYGLVPYTGVFPLELTLDHVGPMARTVADVALLLEAIAGPDGLDPRQAGGPRAERYSSAIDGEVRGLRVGIVEDGFIFEEPEEDVIEAVNESAQAFARLGCEVQQVAIPFHRDGSAILFGIILGGMTSLVLDGNGLGNNWKGHYVTSMLDAFARGRLTRADDLPESVKLLGMAGKYLQEAYHGRYYAKAQNLARALRAAYDRAFSEHDVLVMPTTPIKAAPLTPADLPLEAWSAQGREIARNTGVFNVTGHPALNVPCAMSAGLPVGMMLIGRIGEDATVLRAAQAFASRVFAPPSPRHRDK